MNKKLDKASICWEIIAVVVSLVGIIVSIAIGIVTYNHRYDADAKSADAFKASYSSTSNEASSTLTSSAGSVWYGVFQKSGEPDTWYTVYYKKSTESEYNNLAQRSLGFTKNGAKYKKGQFRLARSHYSMRYDVKIKRISNKTSSSVLEVDWAVENYGA